LSKVINGNAVADPNFMQIS